MSRSIQRVNVDKIRDAYHRLGLTERDLQRRAGLGAGATRGILLNGHIHATTSLARVRRFINELGLTWGDLLDDPEPETPTVYLDPTDRQAALARLITTSKRAVSLDHLAVVFGVTIADIRADLDTLAAPLAALGFRLVSTEDCSVILNRGKDPNADDAAKRLAFLRDSEADLNVSATRTLYRAYTDTLSTRELSNDDRVQVGMLVNRGALQPPASNHRAALTDDTLYCLTVD